MKTAAEDALRQGDPAGALEQLQDAVRRDPADCSLRVFLFQLLCVLGDWKRALTQLELCAELDAAAIPMRETYRSAIQCEMLRAEVFAGRKSPMLFGEPEVWIAQLIESLIRAGRGERDASVALQQQAFEGAPASGGSADDHRFEWIADGDMRLGPLLECIVNGRYCWIPFARLTQVTIEQPADLRDAVWLPANLEFVNGGESIALLPARYPGSESAADGLLALGRKTIWEERSPEVFHGVGQKTLTTDDAEIGLSDLRSLRIDATEVVHA